MVNKGRALVHATYRDPRDMALSMMDHGQRNREAGKAAFTEITNFDAARDNIDSQIDSLTQWLIRPNCLPLFYDDLAFDKETTTRKILAHLHLELSANKVANFVDKKRFTQRNKGIRRRFRSEMSYAERRRFRVQYANYFEKLVKVRKTFPLTGDPIFPDGTRLL
jgi:hypothetical protein